MKELTIVLAIVMPLLACGLNSWLNIKIKFAPTEEQAKRDVRLVLRRVITWISNLYLLGVLIWQFTLPAPLTRLSLLPILVPLLALMNSYMLWWIGQIIVILREQCSIMAAQDRAIRGQLEAMMAHAELTRDQLEVMRKLAEGPPKA